MKVIRLVIRPEAEADLAAAYRWYEDRDTGLGEEFLRAVEAALFGIQKNPQANRKIHKEIRRMITKRFPYGIFYVIDGETVSVLGALHMRRDPTLMTKRSTK